ncbi:trypsin-like peptidase domain-containing protein [Spirillospora sp. NPDC052242]
MVEAEWRAWVGDADGGDKLGAAFLVTPTRLLTCAHTVHGRDEARVGFPGFAEGLPVKVVRCGDWARDGDPGDVAVLELAAEVPLAPATFADPVELCAVGTSGRRFGVWGFPRRRDSGERHATVTTDPSWSRAREWWEIRTVSGDVLEEGYSGSAVYDAASGEVIGMVTNAERRSGADRGWMLPITRIRRYWEDLDDLLPLPWLTAPARRELREILAGVPCEEPLRADLAEVAGRPPVEAFRSAWGAVRFVAEGWPEDRLARFLGALGTRLAEPRRRALGAWTSRHLRADETADEPRTAPASVIVRLERQTFDKAVEITVQTWSDGAVGTSRRIAGVRQEHMQATVEDAIAEVAPTLFGRDWMIEFAVPVDWLGKSFELWHADRRNKILMRQYPVVVRDVERLRPDSFRRDLAHRRWRRLTELGRCDPVPVTCDTAPTGDAFHNRLEADPELCVLLYGRRPKRAWLNAALNNGVPVMLWSRAPCEARAHGDCRGAKVLAELSAVVLGEHPDDLPQIVLRLRKEALVAETDGHCGHKLTILWDDPTRLPDPPLAMEA